MTEQTISPLRRRMIEDMTIRKLASKTQHDYVQRVKDFAVFLGRSPDTAKSGVERHRHAKDQRHRLGAAVLFQCDARSARVGQASVVHARAAQGSRCLKSRRGCALSGG